MTTKWYEVSNVPFFIEAKDKSEALSILMKEVKLCEQNEKGVCEHHDTR